MRRIIFPIFDGLIALDLVGPLQVFATARAHLEAKGAEPPYAIIVASVRGGSVTTAEGLQLHTSAIGDLTAEDFDTIIVPGGSGPVGPLAPEALVQWLRCQAASAGRLCSVCVGAFLLAEAGLLDGRRATTHWAWTEALREGFPKVHVEHGPVFVRDGSVWTSAGVTAGLDLALHLVEADLGRNIAMDVAKALVLFLRRPGNQGQFSSALKLQSNSGLNFSQLLAWAADNPSSDLSVPALARKVGMTPRTFARKFQRDVGSTPGSAINALRLETSKRLLVDTELPLKQVAAQSGYGGEQALRRAFRSAIGASPTSYRERFR